MRPSLMTLIFVHHGICSDVCSDTYLLRCPLRFLLSCLLRCQLRCLLGWILLILRGSYRKYLKLFIGILGGSSENIHIRVSSKWYVQWYSRIFRSSLFWDSVDCLVFSSSGNRICHSFFNCDNDHCCQFDIFRAVPYPKYSSCVFTTINNGNLWCCSY